MNYQTPTAKLRIQLRLGNTLLNITVPANQEEIFRAASHAINEKLGRYQESYPTMTYDSCFAMTVLDYAITSMKMEEDKDTAPYDVAIRGLTAEIEETLRLVDDRKTNTATNAPVSEE